MAVIRTLFMLIKQFLPYPQYRYSTNNAKHEVGEIAFAKLLNHGKEQPKFENVTKCHGLLCVQSKSRASAAFVVFVRNAKLSQKDPPYHRDMEDFSYLYRRIRNNGSSFQNLYNVCIK